MCKNTHILDFRARGTWQSTLQYSRLYTDILANSYCNIAKDVLRDAVLRMYHHVLYFKNYIQFYSKSAHVILYTSVTKARHRMSPCSRNTEMFNSTAWFKKTDSMLQNWLLPQISEDSEDFIFQQDGAPPHWHRNVRHFLNESLPQRSIGRVGKEDLALQFWPPRSPDLTPCDFFWWGFVKDAFHVPSLPTILDDLKSRITTAVNSVTQDILLRVWNEFSYRLDATRAAGGGHIEHL